MRSVYQRNHGEESPFIELHRLLLHRLLLEHLTLTEAVGKVAARTRIAPRTAIDRLDQDSSMTKLCVAWRYIIIRDALIGKFTDSTWLSEKPRSRSAVKLTQAYAYLGSCLFRLTLTQAHARDIVPSQISLVICQIQEKPRS